MSQSVSPSNTPTSSRGEPRRDTAGCDRRPVGLLVAQLCALAGQVLAVSMARGGQHRGVAELVSDLSLMLAYGSALWVLTAPCLDRRTRNAAVVCLGLAPTLMWRATNPTLFTGFDEQLHMRTLGDILSSHRLFEANPLLEVSARYPGLEALTALIHQTGLPAMVSATLVILVARLVLVTVLCDAVEQITGSARAGGLAVAFYALSSQFVFFNSQYSYQTLAIPLALAAVSFLARARSAEQPLPFAGGATVCLLALAITHHATSFITAGWLLAWTVLEKRSRRRWVGYGACAAIGSTLAWAGVQREILTGYFGPIIDDVIAQFRGGTTRELFTDSAGTAVGSVDRYLLLYYALALTLIALALLALAYHEHHLHWGPVLALAVLSTTIPVLLAARVVPKGVEVYDRSNSFLFLPFGVYLASFTGWFLFRKRDQPGYRHTPRAVLVHALAVLAAALTFLGGYVLGSGPNWARLPGPYLVAADTRSMDAETLAAVKWAQALPAGSRIAGDRVSSTLLASQAGLWPVMKGPVGVDAPALYVADSWGMTETDMAASMRLRYLYVDRRLASELPHFGSYFFQGETGSGRQLTDAQLTKFDSVPGISVVYRHGPVSIYDLKGLGLPQQRSGWFGLTPRQHLSTQLALGATAGLLLSLLIRSRRWPAIMAAVTRLRRTWGAALMAATAVAGATLVSIIALLAGVWITPVILLSAAAVVVLTNPSSTVSLLRRCPACLRRPTVRTVALAVTAATILMAVAGWDAVSNDTVEVGRILHDPNAIHRPQAGVEQREQLERIGN